LFRDMSPNAFIAADMVACDRPRAEAEEVEVEAAGRGGGKQASGRLHSHNLTQASR
jgi:hypothetical protein